MALLAGRGEGADLQTAPDAVAPAGDDAVDRIGKEDGNKSEESGYSRPGLGQFAKRSKDGSRADENLGTCGERQADDEDGARGTGGVRRLGVCSEKSGEGGIAERREAQAVFSVAADEPADGGVAEAAVAVVDDEEAIAELVRAELGNGVHYQEGCG
jgi:hypothetical protein